MLPWNIWRKIAVLGRVAGILAVGFLGACKQVPTGPCIVVAHTGSIQADSNPSGAAIWLDGTSAGKITPATLSGLAPGNHKLVLKKSCNQDEDRMVTVPEDGVTNVFVDMQPGIPVLLEPSPGAELDNGRTDGKDSIIWDFKWKEVKGAAAYNLYVIGPTAIYPVINANVYGLAYHHVSYGSYISYYRNWQWKVRAYINGAWCSWSEPRYFNVERVNTDPPSN